MVLLKKKRSRFEREETSLNQESILTRARREVTETLTTIARKGPRNAITIVRIEEDTLVRRDLGLEVGLLKGITADIDEQNQMYVIFQFSDISYFIKINS